MGNKKNELINYLTEESLKKLKPIDFELFNAIKNLESVEIIEKLINNGANVNLKLEWKGDLNKKDYLKVVFKNYLSFYEYYEEKSILLVSNLLELLTVNLFIYSMTNVMDNLINNSNYKHMISNKNSFYKERKKSKNILLLLLDNGFNFNTIDSSLYILDLCDFIKLDKLLLDGNLIEKKEYDIDLKILKHIFISKLNWDEEIKKYDNMTLFMFFMSKSEIYSYYYITQNPYKIDINKKDEFGANLLIYAICYADLEFVKYLLKKGIDNYKNDKESILKLILLSLLNYKYEIFKYLKNDIYEITNKEILEVIDNLKFNTSKKVVIQENSLLDNIYKLDNDPYPWNKVNKNKKLFYNTMFDILNEVLFSNMKLIESPILEQFQIVKKQILNIKKGSMTKFDFMKDIFTKLVGQDIFEENIEDRFKSRISPFNKEYKIEDIDFLEIIEYLDNKTEEDKQFLLELSFKFNNEYGNSTALKAFKKLILELSTNINFTMKNGHSFIETIKRKGTKNMLNIVKESPYYIRDTHNPKRLVEILTNFRNDTPMKYTTHNWDFSNKEYKNFDDFISKVKRQWDEIEEELKKLSPNIHKKINLFLFDKEKKESWSSIDGDKLSIGWLNLKELKEHCDSGKKPFEFKLEQNYDVGNKLIISFEDVVNIFKKEIQIRSENTHLENIIMDLEDYITDKNDNFEIKPIKLKGKSFYTDVEILKDTIKRILEAMLNREDYPEIKVEVRNENEESFELVITQIDSFSNISPQSILKKVEGGDFSIINKNLKNLCDWSIENKYEGKSYRVNYLNYKHEEEIKNLDDDIEGFSYVLRFYK